MTLPINYILAQINPTVGDLDGNLDKIRYVRDTNPDSDLIIYSEMVITAYPADDLLLKPSFIDAVHEKIQILIEESKSHKPYLLIGTPWREKGTLYNAAVVIGDGIIQHVSIKKELPNYGVFDEKRYFTSPATLSLPFDFKDTRLGIMICEDMWSSRMANHYKTLGTQQLIVINGSPFHKNVYDRRLDQAQTRVRETKLPLIYVNQCGGQDDLVFDGSSFALDNKGEVIHQSKFCEEDISALSTQDEDHPLDEEKLYKAATLGLKDYVQKNGFKGILLGLSGGIDSALSAAMAVDAIGAENVHCAMLPSPYTSQDSLDDAAECAKLLGVTLDTISINDGMTALKEMLKGHAQENTTTTTFENIQSRLRGITLMALSNETGKMLLTTGNKSEMAVGYATLYGDMCGGYNAIKDLYKTEIYALSEWRNDESLVIPERIITKAPTAELKPNQTDQDTLPAYDVLDEILDCLIEKEMSVKDIKQHENALVEKIWGMIKFSEYKRYQSAPGPKLTSKSFGRDRRYPMTNKF